MTAAPKFRIDVTINDLLTSADQRPPAPAEAKGLSLPSPVFPQFPSAFWSLVLRLLPISENGVFATFTGPPAGGSFCIFVPA